MKKRIRTAIVMGACMLGAHCVAQEVSPMLRNAEAFKGTPYVAGTLEKEGEEHLVIDTAGVDCTTMVEYVLAKSLCRNRKDECFAHQLQRIRYRDGKIAGYPSRLHYVSDWIENGVRNGFMEDVTAAHSPYTQKLSLSFMTTHRHLYKQPAGSQENTTAFSENVAALSETEKALSGKTVRWIPKDRLPVAGLPYIKDGDIIAITSAKQGLDVAHMGIAVYVNGQLHLLHASSAKKLVVTDPLPLSRLLALNRNWTGIRVLRAVYR